MIRLDKAINVLLILTSTVILANFCRNYYIIQANKPTKERKQIGSVRANGLGANLRAWKKCDPLKLMQQSLKTL